MKVSIANNHSKHYTIPPPANPVSHQCCTVRQRVSFKTQRSPQLWDAFRSTVGSDRLGSRWMEYQGVRDWDGLLDPLDDNLRAEILRYGYFVEAAYRSFDFDPSLPTYGTCRFRKKDLLRDSGFPDTGYRVTQNLRATSGIQLPCWTERAPRWAVMRSSWIGYVAVCHDKEELARLGRRDVVIAFRGTTTCLEWLENIRVTLSNFPGSSGSMDDGSGPMVESGFLSLYTSAAAACPSLQEMIRREISRILNRYKNEKLSFTITGHSLGAALATLAAYDIKTTFERDSLVTVISFGGPRVGNRSFRREVEKQGAKILRIVNPDDLITKLPGFLVESNDEDEEEETAAVRTASSGPWSWFQKRMEYAQWAYAEVGHELRLMSPTAADPPYLINNMNVAKCHDLKTYLHLVAGFISSDCPLRATARRLLKRNNNKNNNQRM